MAHVQFLLLGLATTKPLCSGSKLETTTVDLLWSGKKKRLVSAFPCENSINSLKVLRNIDDGLFFFFVVFFHYSFLNFYRNYLVTSVPEVRLLRVGTVELAM